MKKRKESRKVSRHPINGETLRAAVAWAINAKVFTHLKFHGNTSWQVIDLILLTIVWVWSGNTSLTGAFAEARSWSSGTLGRCAVKTFQGLMKALVAGTAKLLPKNVRIPGPPTPPVNVGLMVPPRPGLAPNDGDAPGAPPPGGVVG